MRVLTCFKIVVGLALLATFSFFYSLLSVTEIPMREDYIEIPSLRYHIDTVNVGKRSVFISGWVLDKGHVVANDSSDFTYRAFSDTPIIPKCFAYNIILRNTETNKFYKIKTFGVSRPDVTKHFNDGEDYNASGFNAKLYKAMLPDAGKYEILLEYVFFNNRVNKRALLKTGKDFEKG